MILCTNDDGLGTIGLETLVEVCREFDEVFVIAPDRERSLCSHSLDPTGDLRLEEVEEKVFSLSGTPADCTRIGLRHFEERPVLVCSGINHGGNLGADVLYSGTIAATREAFHRGISGISFSMVLKSGVDPSWGKAKDVIRDVLLKWKEARVQNPIFWNVNFPHQWQKNFSLIECSTDSTPMELTYQRTESGYLYSGNYHSRPRIGGADIDICFRGQPVLCDLEKFAPGNKKSSIL